MRKGSGKAGISGGHSRTLWQKLVAVLGAGAVRYLLQFYPPLFGAGVRVVRIDSKFREIVVEMPLYPWTRNYVGTHFGGSLYAMCDPFYMLMMMQNLGRGYVVWDKSATIEFLRPGRSKVRAVFKITEDQIRQIRDEADSTGRAYPTLTVVVEGEGGEAIARIGKVLSVRKAGR